MFPRFMFLRNVTLYPDNVELENETCSLKKSIIKRKKTNKTTNIIIMYFCS